MRARITLTAGEQQHSVLVSRRSVDSCLKIGTDFEELPEGHPGKERIGYDFPAELDTLRNAMGQLFEEFDIHSDNIQWAWELLHVLLQADLWGSAQTLTVTGRGWTLDLKLLPGTSE